VYVVQGSGICVEDSNLLGWDIMYTLYDIHRILLPPSSEPKKPRT